MRVEVSKVCESLTVQITTYQQSVRIFFGDSGGTLLLTKDEAADLRDKLSSCLPVSKSPLIGDFLRTFDAERVAQARAWSAVGAYESQLSHEALGNARRETDRVRAALESSALKVAA